MISRATANNTCDVLHNWMLRMHLKNGLLISDHNMVQLLSKLAAVEGSLTLRKSLRRVLKRWIATGQRRQAKRTEARLQADKQRFRTTKKKKKRRDEEE